MGMSPELEEAIACGDSDTCVTILSVLNETERRAMSQSVIATYQVIDKERYSDTKSQPWANVQARYIAAGLAVLGTSTFGEIRSLKLMSWDARAFDVLAARKPAWLDNWCDWVLRDSSMAWHIVRRFVREGICERPTSEMYVLWMAERANQKSVKDFLLADPTLLETELWQLFRVEGNAAISLNSAEKYGRSKWSDALVSLCADSRISRDRLLDESLNALMYDFAEYRAGWFSRFHEKLKPTQAERAVRVNQYLTLIASRIPPTVAFALKAVAELDRAELVSPVVGMAAVGPAFHAREKGTITLALKLAQSWVRRDPSLVQTAVEIVRPALEHEIRDVREVVQKFLDKYAPEHSDAAGDQTGPGEPLPAQYELITPQMAGIEPIETVAELIQLLSAVIENEGPPDDLERVLDGVSRLCGGLAPEFTRLAGPLRKRAASLIQKATGAQFAPYSVKLAFCELAIAWIDGTVPSLPGRQRLSGLSLFLDARLREVTARAAERRPSKLLAAPTYIGGWVDPLAFVQRLSATTTPDRLDLIQALLRLRFENREAAKAAAVSLTGELGDAVRHALGEDNITVGSDTALWVAASRARAPWDSDARVAGKHGTPGPDTTAPARITFGWKTTEYQVEGKTYRHYHPAMTVDVAIPGAQDVEFPAVLVYQMGKSRDYGEWEAALTERPDSAFLRWASTVWPGYRESWCAIGCRELGDNLDWWEARWGNRIFLEPLLDPGAKLGALSLVLIALGLAAKDAGEGMAATDVLIAAISEDRITHIGMTNLFREMFSWEHIKMPRVSPRLMQAAQVSYRHATAIRDGLENAIVAHPPTTPASLGIVLDVLYELFLITHEKPKSMDLRDYLNTIRGSHRAASMAGKILSLS
jgi:hypothetical protein